MNSVETQIPFDYYYLHICPPQKFEILSDNLGEILTGDLLQKTKYQFQVGNNEYCKTLCNMEIVLRDVNIQKWMISKNYTTSWFVDKLPAGFKHIVDPNTGKTDVHYLGGIPIGYNDPNAADTYEYKIYNHLTFTVQIHSEGEDSYTIVGFNILPQSIYQNEKTGPKCSTVDIAENFHKEKQGLTEGFSLITYDIVFENSKIPFSSRWDHYLHLQNDNIHWYSLINSSLIILIFSFIVLHIFCRALKRDIDIYNTRVTGEDFIDEFGWKQVCNDVFRKPTYRMLLSSFIGTGLQLFAMIIYTLVFAMIGFYTPEKRGSLLMIMILLFVFMGVFAGYYSSRFYKMFGGKDWLKNSLLTAFLYPGILFFILIILNILFWFEGSSASVIKQIFII
jgi:transmembrane 9 superfamily protein 2/4